MVSKTTPKLKVLVDVVSLDARSLDSIWPSFAVSSPSLSLIHKHPGVSLWTPILSYFREIILEPNQAHVTVVATLKSNLRFRGIGVGLPFMNRGWVHRSTYINGCLSCALSAVLDFLGDAKGRHSSLFSAEYFGGRKWRITTKSSI